MRDLFRQGQRVTARELNEIPRHTLRSIKAGPGIRIMPFGDTVSIMLDGPSGQKNVGGGDSLLRVLVLPAVPTAPGTVKVFWLDSAQGTAELGSPGTGDNQEWSCTYPQARYYPQDKYTTLSGVPV